MSNRGLDIDAAEYEDHFVELHVKHSNALHSVVRGRGSYLVGPLARFNLNFDKLPEVARKAALEVGLKPPVKNHFSEHRGPGSRTRLRLCGGIADHSRIRASRRTASRGRPTG